MRRNRFNPLCAGLACAVLALWSAGFAGCAYQLGSNLPPGIKTVCVPVFVNQTSEPGLEFETTNATIEEFQKDGTLRIVPKDQADSILEVKLTGYTLTPLRYRSNQTTTAREYRLTITAEMIFRKLPANEIIAQDNKVEGYATFDALTDLPSARRTALPPTARNLALHIVKNVVEYW